MELVYLVAREIRYEDPFDSSRPRCGLLVETLSHAALCRARRRRPVPVILRVLARDPDPEMGRPIRP
jgi:hypothetical protein